MLPIRIELLHERAKPHVGSAEAAGIDLRAAMETAAGFVLLDTDESLVVGTGVKVDIPKGWVGLVLPRSGLGFKYEVVLANTCGVIDSDYNGEIKIKLVNRGSEQMDIGDFDRVCQMVIVPHYQVYDNIEYVESLDKDTERGESGFGSSGVN